MSDSLASQLERYFDRLWPLLRSLTREGVRRTHNILSEIVPLSRFEVPTGTAVLDWQIPKEWIVRSAYVVDPLGRRILDVERNNLHLVNYSIPFRGRVPKSEFERHLHSKPDMPAAVPYVTSYYEPRWGFCLRHDERLALPEGDYEVVIDTELADGALTLSEAFLKGESHKEILISTYTCHPSLANNELSGPLVASFLYQALSKRSQRRLSYRFVFAPETIGSIAYLSFRGRHLKEHLVGGLVLTCIGDRGPFTYKRSREGNSVMDRACAIYLRHHFPDTVCVDFYPHGSDEKHYCSPGFNLPIGALMRTSPDKYAQYHTSLDNKEFISFDKLAEAVDVIANVLEVIDRNATYVNLFPFGEPRLGARGLMGTLSRPEHRTKELMAIRWLLNMSDGKHDLLSIAERSQLDPLIISDAALRCSKAGLLTPAVAGKAFPPDLPTQLNFAPENRITSAIRSDD